MAKYKPTPSGELLGDIESEIDAFTKEIDRSSKEKDVGEDKLPFKVPILTRSADKYGHKGQVRCSVPDWMIGYATSLMTAYPQAKTPTDMQRACFYAGIRLLAYIVRERADDNIIFYNTFAKQVEWEMVDLERIDHVKVFIEFLRKKRNDKVITLKHYIDRRNELFSSLHKAIKTEIGNGAYREFVDSIKNQDSTIAEDTNEGFRW